MNRHLLFILSTIIVLVSGKAALPSQKPDKEKLAKKDLANLQGTWFLVSAERRGGEKAPQRFLDTFRMVFQENELTIVMGQKEKKATITLDATKTPKEMDVHSNGINSPTIYSLDKDVLRVVMDEKDKTRAKGFVTEKGSSHMSLELKRTRNQ
jgi:uncharacterized protein (TIGR03067 family)